MRPFLTIAGVLLAVHLALMSWVLHTLAFVVPSIGCLVFVVAIWRWKSE